MQETGEIPPQEQVFDLRNLGLIFWEKRILVIVVTIAVAAVALGSTYLMPRKYTARVTLLPMRGAGALDMLGQFATIPGLQPLVNASFEDLYPIIIESHEVLSPLTDMKWPQRDHEGEVSLATIFGIHAEDGDPRGPARIEDGVQNTLRSRVFSLGRDRISGFMTLEATVARDPELAAKLANALVASLEEYLQRSNQQQARSHADFIRERIAFNEIRLNEAEEAVSDFAQSNKAYASSPKLAREYNVLKREAEAQLATWVELRRQLEIAIIEENNSTPALKILDAATPPLVPSSPNRKLALVLGGMLGIFISLIYIIWANRYRHA